MKNKKQLKRQVQAVVFTFTMMYANFAHAAGSPEAGFLNVIDGLIGIMYIVAPSLATLALAVYGIQYKMADHHKKAELKSSMTSTIVILIVVLSASVIIDWVAARAA
jgi:hypothetical protein